MCTQYTHTYTQCCNTSAHVYQQLALMQNISAHESHIHVMLTCTSLLTLWYSFKIVVVSPTATINEPLTSTTSAIVEIAWEISPGEGEEF